MKYALGLPSTRAALRLLYNAPQVALACGIRAPEDIPHESTLSLFFGKLSKRKYLHLLKNVSRCLVRSHYATQGAFGERVAIDSSVLKAYANSSKPIKADTEAAWNIKKNSYGKTEYVYGWKLHLMVDCEHEIGIAANISPGNVHDSQRATNLLREARFTAKRFRPYFVIGDKAYSGRRLFHHIREQYQAQPIIDVMPVHKTLRQSTLAERSTVAWKALYKQRTVIERMFSRLKGQHSLNNITVRGRWKVTVHCYLSLIAMQAIQSVDSIG